MGEKLDCHVSLFLNVEFSPLGPLQFSYVEQIA